ncbi:NUDIX domain-containing protein [Sphingomonas sp. S6]|jgi:8-oxo-dGTP pyrophosphatase MutT (NUDIX family)|uniref:NUDIX domain-containing protein n=1 Tax=Sphingomonas sp. S6 TaxID=3368600 RepID=UPI000FAC4A1E|nr:NUDIX domain-containing protein [uncultured Sphingomonas sp.]RTL20119.1 MAG: NUDIX domain-containing protein [Sphingomonadaceae bacterium]
MRPLIDLAYRLRRRAMALVGWRTRGVKVMAFDPSGRVLLVRHRYGRSDLWMLPGGGIARGEAPIAAAVRELMEETGCRLDAAAIVGQWEARAEGRRDTVWLVRGSTGDTPQIDGVELAEACFFAPDVLPAAASPATRRRVDELLGRRVSDGRW